jgi:predicted Zn-dependent protease
LNPDAPDPRRATAIDERLAEIERQLGRDPAKADALAGEVLAAVPDHPVALLFQGMARRLAGRPAEAAAVLADLCERTPDAPLAHLQLGLALREAGDAAGAERAMRRAVEVRPDYADAWLALAHLLTAAGAPGAAQAYEGYVRYALQIPRLREAHAALEANRPRDAEALLRRHLEGHPRDVVALRMLASIATRVRRFDEAERLLGECLRLAPGYREAREDLAAVLLRRARPVEAVAELDRLLAQQPGDPKLRARKAAALLRYREYAAAAKIYAALANEQPGDANLWGSLGTCRRILGDAEGSLDAYRRAVTLAPRSGEAWWNLANLKTWQASDDDLATMQAMLADSALGDEDRVHFHFALGKALDDRGDDERAFSHYAEGNRLRRRRLPWDAARFSAQVDRWIALLTPEFFASRAGQGAVEPRPVFVVGLPRSGSTLVEQILASHPSIEGTAELPHLPVLVEELAARHPGATWPDLLVDLAPEELRRLGDEYLERSRPWRKLGRPLFTDKLPSNFEHTGLIHLALPGAIVVDVRRDPMACGFSLFRHLFARGQAFSYDLGDIGRYYADYARLMAHFDAVLPGRVHRVSYEALVEDTEAEVRRLLAACGLPFDPACLAFGQAERPIATPSSEQVRQGIFREGLDHWRRFAPWLGPLEQALGGASTG